MRIAGLSLIFSGAFLLVTGCGRFARDTNIVSDCFLEVSPLVVQTTMLIYQRKDTGLYRMHVVTWEGEYIELEGPGWETLPGVIWQQGDRLISVDGCTVRDVVRFGPGEGSRDLAPMIDEGIVSKLNFVLSVPRSGWRRRVHTVVIERRGERQTIIVAPEN